MKTTRHFLALLLPLSFACASEPPVPAESATAEPGLQLDGLGDEQLASIALSKESSRLRTDAIGRIRSQDVLLKVVLAADDYDAAHYAFQRLTNPSGETVATIAQRAASARLRDRMVERIDDQKVLLDIVKKDTDREVRERAVQRLKDPVVLAQLAKDENMPADARARAVLRVTDQDVLASIAESSAPNEVREKAIVNLSTEAVLRRLLSDPSQSVAQAAVDRIGDYAWLASIGKDDARPNVRHWALRRLDTLVATTKVPLSPAVVQTMRAIALRDDDPMNRASALRLGGDEKFALEVARKDTTWQVRAAAVAVVHSVKGLEELAGDADQLVRRKALDALEKAGGEAALIHMAEAGATPPGRRGAIERLGNVEVLERIAKSDRDESVRAAAANVLNGPLILTGKLLSAGRPHRSRIYFIPAQVTSEAVTLSATFAGGTPNHPGADSDQEGKFTISVPRAAVAGGKTFTLGFIDARGAMNPLLVGKEPLVLKLEKPTLRLDVGSVDVVDRR